MCFGNLHFQLTGRTAITFYTRKTSLFLCECVLMSEAVPRLLNAARVVFMAWLKPMSCHVVPVFLTSLAMVAFTFQRELVFRTSRAEKAGQRKLTTWSEYWMNGLPASFALAKHGKPCKFVWRRFCSSPSGHTLTMSCDTLHATDHWVHGQPILLFIKWLFWRLCSFSERGLPPARLFRWAVVCTSLNRSLRSPQLNASLASL